MIWPQGFLRVLILSEILVHPCSSICVQRLPNYPPQFLEGSMCVLVAPVVSDFLQPHRLQTVRLLCPWNSLGKNTGVGCHSLLQRIFPTQGSNPGLLHCRQILYHLSYQGSPGRQLSGRVKIWISILRKCFCCCCC